MPADRRDERIADRQERLRELEARFDREMRARGFDPSQASTTALPAALASLYAAVEEARAELSELSGEED